MVDGQQRERLDELRLNGRGADDDQRLFREHRRPLRDGVDVAGKAEVPQIVQKLLAEQLPPPKIRNILLGKVQVLDVVDQLLQSGGNGEAAAVRHFAEKHVEIGDAILVACLKVAIPHGQLIKVTEHGHVQLFLSFHSYTSNRSLRAAQSVVSILYRFFPVKATPAAFSLDFLPILAGKPTVNQQSVAFFGASVTMSVR